MTTRFFALRFLAGLALLGVAALSIGQQCYPDAPTIGQPWVGEMGITETVEQIMDRDRANPNPFPGRFRYTGPEHEIDRTWVRPNPDALPGSQWPPLSGALRGKGDVGPLNPQPVGTSFAGPGLSDTPGFVPPDSMGDVGPTQILVVVNGRIRVYDKSGTLGALNTTTDSFFASVRTSTVADPFVRYDRTSGRWFVSMIDVSTPNRVLLAVSSGATITGAGSFTFFQFQHDLVGTTPNSDTGGFCDYLSMGVDANAVYLGGNIFNAAGTSFIGTTGYVVRKSSVTGGGPIVVTAFRQMAASGGAGPFAPRGVDQTDPAAAEGYFIGVDNNVFSRLTIRRISTPGGTPTISANISVNVPTTVFPQNTPCLGSTSPLAGLDDRLFQARMFRNRLTGVTTLWTAHNIEVDAAGNGNSAGNRNGCRWYQLQNMTGTPTLVQSGTLFDSAASNPNNYWIPSVAMNGQGHMALSCSVAGAARRAEIATAGRLSSDGLGTIQAPTTVQTSSTNYNIGLQNGSYRWGDYSASGVDPMDDMTIWSFQEYCDANNSWRVRVFQLLAPPPATVSSLTPNTLAQGATTNIVVAGTSVNGSGWFDTEAGMNRLAAAFSGTGVTVNSITFTSPTSITLNVTASGSATTGARNLTITNPDGQNLTANSVLTITSGSNPVPTLTSITPNSATAGGSAFTLNLTGTNFIAGSIVRWNGSDRTTTFVSATSLQASITAADIANAGTASVTVFNPAPGGGTSGGQTFTINNPVPTTTSITPSSVTAGGSAFTLTVNGTNFNTQSVVRFNGSNRTTTFVSATQLQASITAADIATAGTASITVFNPSPGGGTSGGQTLTINNPAPTTTSISPTSATAGGSAFTLTVNGTNFNSQSIVRWNGSNRTTTFVSATQLQASITAADIATAGTASVTVFNPAPGGGTSNGQTFTINNPAPIATTLSPSSAISGGPGFTLTINGTGFVATSQVTWNGSNRTTTFISATQLQASIPASDIAVAGTANVRVVNPAPGGGTSSPLTFTINPTVVSGNVILGDWLASPTTVPVTIEIRNVGSTTPIISQTVSLNASGNFSFNVNLAPGTYDVTAKASHWLRKKRGSQSSAGGALSGQNFVLVNGDCDNDNEVAVGDFAILSAAFGTSVGDPGYNAAADLNGDGDVDIGDFAILSANFGLTGDD